MTSSEKNSGRPTLRAAAMITADALGWRRARAHAPRWKCSRNLCAFSTMMIAASTMAPMAMAMPPKRHDVGGQPHQMHRQEERRMATGSVMMATRAERTCQRKTRQTSATTMLSSISFSRSVLIESRIRPLRS